MSFTFFSLYFFLSLTCAWNSGGPYDGNLQYHLDRVHLSTLTAGGAPGTSVSFTAKPSGS